MIGDVVKATKEAGAYVQSQDIMKIVKFRKANSKSDYICAVTNKGNNFGFGIDLLQHHIEEKDTFVLPEKWCIKQNVSDEVCNWFSKKRGTKTANIKGNWKYLCYNLKSEWESHFTSAITKEYKEITLEQFKKYVLNK